jgi:hypothetical protein
MQLAIGEVLVDVIVDDVAFEVPLRLSARLGSGRANEARRGSRAGFSGIWRATDWSSLYSPS